MGMCGETLAVDLLLEDVHYAADMLRHVFDTTDGVDGWVAIPVSPLNSDNSKDLKKSIMDLHCKIKRPNVLITIPGFLEYPELIEDLVFAGLQINISLIYSHEQYISAADSYLRGIERRINAGLNPSVTAFVSISVSSLAEVLSKKTAKETASQVTIAIARKIYRSMKIQHKSQKWERTYNAGARILRLIWVNSAEEQATAAGRLLTSQLIAPLTVASMPPKVLKNFTYSDQLQVLMPENGDDCDEVLSRSKNIGINFEHIANSLQRKMADDQIKKRIILLDMLARRSASIIQNKNLRIKGA